MRRPRREAGGSEVALMAVITKAMGAFLVLVVIMLPHYVYAPTSIENAKRANEQIEQARETARQIADRLKQGRLTDAEIDELLRRIEQMQTSLAAAHNEIAALKRSLDQAHSEIERQKKTIEAQAERVASLDAEVKRLTEELSSLRKIKPDFGALVASVTWRDCPGADFEIFIESDGISAIDGKPTAAVNRDNQTGYWEGEQRFSTNSYASWRAGSVTAIRPGIPAEERLLFWVKLRNALPFGGAEDRSCQLFGKLMPTNHALSAVNRTRISDKSPIVLMMQVAKTRDGQITPQAPAVEMVAARFASLKSSPCNGLLCFAERAAGETIDATEVKAAFLKYASDNYEISDSSAEELFTLAAEGAMSVSEMYQWLGAFPKKKNKEGVTDDAVVSAAVRQLDNLAAPSRVRAELTHLLQRREAHPVYIAESLTGLTGREQKDAKFATRLLRRAHHALGKAVRDNTITGSDRAALEILWLTDLNMQAALNSPAATAAKPQFFDRIETTLARTTLPEPLQDVVRHIALSGFVSSPPGVWEAALARFVKQAPTGEGRRPPP